MKNNFRYIGFQTLIIFMLVALVCAEPPSKGAAKFQELQKLSWPFSFDEARATVGGTEKLVKSIAVNEYRWDLPKDPSGAPNFIVVLFDASNKYVMITAESGTHPKELKTSTATLEDYQKALSSPGSLGSKRTLEDYRWMFDDRSYVFATFLDRKAKAYTFSEVGTFIPNKTVPECHESRLVDPGCEAAFGAGTKDSPFFKSTCTYIKELHNSYCGESKCQLTWIDTANCPGLTKKCTSTRLYATDKKACQASEDYYNTYVANRNK